MEADVEPSGQTTGSRTDLGAPFSGRSGVGGCCDGPAERRTMADQVGEDEAVSAVQGWGMR